MTISRGGDSSASPFLYSHDGNKNVSEIVDVGTGEIFAHYEYSSFGKVVLVTSERGDNAVAINPHRFASEYHDDALRLVYYNYRHYNPGDGRWMERDVAEDYVEGFSYNYIYNDINRIEIVGLSDCEKEGKCRTSRPRPGYSPPKPNGCGSGWNTYVVPDRYFATIGIFVIPIEFTDACNNHDNCYSTCGEPRKKCDAGLLDDMKKICNSFPVWLSPEGYIKCQMMSYVYYGAVRAAAGGAYETAQDKACECESCCKEINN